MKVTELTQSKLCLLIQKIMMQSESTQHFFHPEVFPCLHRTQLEELQMLWGINKSSKIEDWVRGGAWYSLSILQEKGQKVSEIMNLITSRELNERDVKAVILLQVWCGTSTLHQVDLLFRQSIVKGCSLWWGIDLAFVPLDLSCWFISFPFTSQNIFLKYQVHGTVLGVCHPFPSEAWGKTSLLSCLWEWWVIICPCSNNLFNQ